MSNLLSDANIQHQLLTGLQDEQEASLIAKAGQVGAVTIATNIAGRGTDIKLGEGAAERGGLHVIATELFASSRVERQLMGRAGRQGDPGSFEMVVSTDDPLLQRFLPGMASEWKRKLAQSSMSESEWLPEIRKFKRKSSVNVMQNVEQSSPTTTGSKKCFVISLIASRGYNDWNICALLERFSEAISISFTDLTLGTGLEFPGKIPAIVDSMR